MNVILFDLDGTLLDSTEAILEGFEQAFLAHSSKMPCHEDVLSLIGHPLDVMFSRLNVHEEQVESHVLAYKEHYRTISMLKTEFLPNAKKAIEYAKSFATLGIVTTKTGRYSKELLEHMGVMHHFDVLIGREHVENPKPHEEPILKALSALRANPEKTWMIGDTSLDMISAKNANIKSVGVECGYGKREELLQYSKYVKSDSLEAVKFIEEICVKNTQIFK